MFYITWTMELPALHSVKTGGVCEQPHGHNYIVTIYCKNDTLDENGMVIDYKVIAKILEDAMYHQDLNKTIDKNPTAENIAQWVVDNVPFCYKAKVCETSRAEAIYTRN